MLFRNAIRIYMLPIVLLLIGPAYSAPIVDPRAEAIMLQQRSYWSSITSIEFKSRYTVNPGQVVQDGFVKEFGKSPTTLYNDLVFRSSGTRFRSEVTNSDDIALKSGSVIVAYDGHLRRCLYTDVPNGPLLTVEQDVHKSLPYETSNPMLKPFAWAFYSGDEQTVSALGRAGTWAGVLARVTGVRDDARRGHDGVTVTLVGPGACDGREFTYEVFFAADLDYYPIYWKCSDLEGRYGEFDVSVWKTVDAGGLTTIVPTSMSGQIHESSSVLISSGTEVIDAASIKLNGSIEDSQFTIPVSAAKMYRDVDSGLEFWL